MKEKFLISGLILAVVIAGTVVVMAWDDPIPVHAHDSETLISVLQMMQQKSGPTREQCFDNQLTLAGLLTDWQPLQPPSPTTMGLNEWVIATVLNTQLYAMCGQWTPVCDDTFPCVTWTIDTSDYDTDITDDEALYIDITE